MSAVIDYSSLTATAQARARLIRNSGGWPVARPRGQGYQVEDLSDGWQPGEEWLQIVFPEEASFEICPRCGSKLLMQLDDEVWQCGNCDFEIDPGVDPTLAEHLDELVDIANEIGAEGVWLVRGDKNARLTYTPEEEIKQPDVPGVQASASLSLSLDLLEAGVLVVMRFPARDSREAGIEKR
jgi:hypothetical protein